MTKVKNSNILYLNGAQAAAFLGISYARLQQLLLDDDPPPRLENKTYPSDELGEWTRRRAVLKAMGVRRNSPTQDPDPDMPVMLNPIQERARKDKELADKASLENQVRRGELVEASIVGSKWKEIMLRVRSRMMRIPWASAPLLVGEEDQIKIQMTIEDQIRDALTELSAD
jgi:hypothetical protein